MSNDSGYSEQEDVQNMIDRAVERDGPTYVRENIDRLLGGISLVMSVDKDALEIPTALDAALARREPATGIDPAVTRAQTRRAAEHFAATGDQLGRADLVDALADGSTLDAATWWGRAVDPGLRRLADADLVEYHAVDDTYRWVSEGGTVTDTRTASEKIREYCRTNPEVFDDTTEIHALAEGQIYYARYDTARGRVDVDHALAYELVTCPECRRITEHRDGLTDCCGAVVPGGEL